MTIITFHTFIISTFSLHLCTAQLPPRHLIAELMVLAKNIVAVVYTIM